MERLEEMLNNVADELRAMPDVPLSCDGVESDSPLTEPLVALLVGRDVKPSELAEVVGYLASFFCNF